VNVNISGPSWVDPTFSKYVFETLEEFPPNLGERLGLEITETALIDDIPEACTNIEKLRERKILIFLDDFGSSYSSAAYLRDLPVDVVKLDGSFTESFQNNARSLDIARCLLEAATRCGCRTVMEHISSPQLLEHARHLNADCGQGFHVGKLLTEEELPAE
jgi:EAL domain-containing protein (putative c-di-GMP-specific phosphodiesterase class I)